MFITIPAWIWAGTAAVAVPVLVVVFVVVWEISRPRPTLVLRGDGSRLELWTGQPRMPTRSDLVIVPVAPDLKLVAGAAHWVRGVTAGRTQAEADAHAPRDPGDAVLVTGSRGRLPRVALAVVMDERKRYSAEWAIAAVRRAIEASRVDGVASVLIPDWTPDLMRQPRRQDAEFRRHEAEQIAPLVRDVALSLLGEVPVIRVWVPDPALADVYRTAFALEGSAQAVAA